MMASLVLTSLLSLAQAEPSGKDVRGTSRSVSFERMSDGRVELTIREEDAATGRKDCKSYKADSIEDFKKQYPDVARDYQIDRLATDPKWLSPDGGPWSAWRGWTKDAGDEDFWNGRFEEIVAPWIPFWPAPMKFGLAQGAARARLFGVQVGPVDESLAAQLDLPSGEGVMVREVTGGSAAEKAGLRRHDLIVRLDGKPVAGAAAFRRDLSERHGKGFELEFVRKGKRERVRVGPDEF